MLPSEGENTGVETNSEVEFEELLGFLQDKKAEVQRFAVEGVLAQTDSQDFLDYCRRNPRKAARPLLRLAEKCEADTVTNSAAAEVAAASATGTGRDKAVKQATFDAQQAAVTGSTALQALVNLSAIPTVRDELVELSAPRRTCESMRSGWLEGRSSHAHWYAMLLANITTIKAGQEAVCADESMFRFLVAAYIAKPRPPARAGYDDPLLFLGKLLNNCCALETGRRLLAHGEQGPQTVQSLVSELADRARRPDMISLMRNLCLDTTCHAAVIAANPLPAMALFLYPWEKASAEDRGKLPDELASALSGAGAAMTGDAQVRHGAAICILGLCRSTEGRAYLLAQGAVDILTAWQAEEPMQETKSALDMVFPALQEPAVPTEQNEAATGEVAGLFEGCEK